MTLQEKIERRSKVAAQVKSILNSPGKLSDADTARVSTLFDEAYSLEDQILAESPTAPIEQRSAGRPPRAQPQSAAQTRSANVQAQKNAFRDWMRSGLVPAEQRSHLLTAETRDMGVSAPGGVITGGNVLVPTGFDPQLHSALLSYGALAAAVRNFATDSGGPMKVALDDDTANGLSLHPETTAAAELDPLVSGFTSYVDDATTGLVSVSNPLLNDSAFSVDDFITNKFGARYYRGLAKWIAQGNGSNLQKLTPGAVVDAPTGSSTSVTLDTIVDAYALLDANYQENASWVMTTATKAILMKLKDGYGHSLLQPDATGKPFNSIFGRPIVIAQYMDAMGPGKTPIYFGDLQASYTLRTVGGLQVARSTDFLFSRNETAFVGWARVGGYNTSQASSPSLVGIQNSAS